MIKEILFFGLFSASAYISHGQSDNISKVATIDSSKRIGIRIIRADFAKKLPHQSNIITDLTGALSQEELKRLDSIWQNFYKISKKGIATMILDSGRIEQNSFFEFAQVIHDEWPIPEKEYCIHVILSPSLKMVEIFVGNLIKNALSISDIEELNSSIVLSIQTNDLYLIIRNLQNEIINKVKLDGG